MDSQELPETTINGLVTVSDFYPEQYKSIESGLNQAEISYQIEFHPPASGNPENSFRVYVDSGDLEAARQLCKSIELSQRIVL